MSKLVVYNGLNNVENFSLIETITSNYGNKKIGKSEEEKKQKSLNWNIDIVESYLGKHANKLRMSYKMVNKWMKFSKEESKLFLI